MSDNIRRRMDQLEHMIATNQIGAAGVFTQMRQLVQATQAQASKPIAVVHGWFHGECVIRPLDPEAVLPAGMALYSQPQAQAGDGEAVGEVFDVLCEGRIVYVNVYDGVVIPHKTKLYTRPQPAQQVNQQLLEALQKAESHLHAMMAHIDHKPQRFQEHCWQQVLDIRAAIAAAQEQK